MSAAADLFEELERLKLLTPQAVRPKASLTPLFGTSFKPNAAWLTGTRRPGSNKSLTNRMRSLP